MKNKKRTLKRVLYLKNYTFIPILFNTSCGLQLGQCLITKVSPRLSTYLKRGIGAGQSLPQTSHISVITDSGLISAELSLSKNPIYDLAFRD